MRRSETTVSQRVLNIWAISLIIWSFYRVGFQTNLPIWFDEGIVKPLIFLVPAAWYIRRMEKKTLLGGFALMRPTRHAMREALLVGIILICISFIMHMYKGGNVLIISIAHFSIVPTVFSIIAVIVEQLLSTGFVFKRLYEDKKQVFSPVLTSAALYFFLHIPVLFGPSTIVLSSVILTVVLNTILSVMASILYIRHKNTLPSLVVSACFVIALLVA